MIHYYKGRFSEAGIMLDPTEPAFRFGVGFFETLYYNGKDVCHIDLHLDRLLHSLRVYGIDYGTVDFSAVMAEVLKRNGLQGTTARINIFYPMESPKAQPAIMAVPYEPKPYKGYRLCLCDDRHISTLNEQKTTSYMFHHLAFRKALARGFDDAALFDFDDNLLESTTGALLFKDGDDFIEMDSPYKLPSTALSLAGTVHSLIRKKITLNEIGRFRHAYILNSLIGMRPVVTIGETAFVPDEASCAPVTAVVLGEK